MVNSYFLSDDEFVFNVQWHTLLTCQDEDKCCDIGHDIITKASILRTRYRNINEG